MDRNRLAKHRWLQPYLENAAYEIPVWVERRMVSREVSLMDVHHAIASTRVDYADGDYGGYHFAMTGRNFDDETIKVCGWFDPATMIFSVTDIDRG